MYTEIYNFLASLFPESLTAAQISFCELTTLGTLLALYLCACCFVKYLFKFVSGLFLWK